MTLEILTVTTTVIILWKLVLSGRTCSSQLS